MEELGREAGRQMIQRESVVPMKWRKAATGPGWGGSTERLI